MQKLSNLVVVAALLSITSCVAPTAKQENKARLDPYEKIVKRAIAKPVSEIIEEWGAPMKSYTQHNREYLVFEGLVATQKHFGKGPDRCDKMPVPVIDFRTCQRNPETYSGPKGYADYVVCVYVFEISKGVVVSGEGKGGGCPRRQRGFR